MSVIEIIIVICAALFVGGVIIASLIARKKGKHCCHQCQYCAKNCSHAAEKESKEPKNVA